MPNTSEKRSRSGLCKRVIRREATETEGLVYTVKGQKFSTTINFTHYIRGNYSQKNLLELKNNIEVYKYHKIGYLRSTMVISFEKYSIL